MDKSNYSVLSDGTEGPDYQEDEDADLEEDELSTSPLPDNAAPFDDSRFRESEQTEKTVGQLDGLERELKSIEGKAHSNDIKASIKKQRERLKKLTQNIRKGATLRKQRKAIQKRFRKVVTGDSEKRVRDHIREKRKEPPVIKIIDKIFFTLGVANLAVSEYMLLAYPHRFGWWYSFIITLMLSLRWVYYKTLKWRYFMIDFCYFTQVLCLLGVAPFPSDWPSTVRERLLKINFVFGNGPLAAAIPGWNCKLVFHDMDKVVSVYIHVLPMWLLYSQRWFGETKDVFSSYDMWDFLFAVGAYCFWQLLYYYKTEMLDKAVLEADPALVTSLRWLSSDKKNAMHKLVLKVMRRAKLMGPQEEFDSTTVKTKVIFMASQLVYTLVTFTPCIFIYNSFMMHTMYGLLISMWAVWNGAVYYIDVFSFRYQKKLAELEDEKREKQM